MTFRERFIPALIAGCLAGLAAAVLLHVLLPDEMRGPSLAEMQGLTNFQVFLRALGGGLLAFVLASLAQWREVCDSYRSWMLVRACRAANQRILSRPA